MKSASTSQSLLIFRTSEPILPQPRSFLVTNQWKTIKGTLLLHSNLFVHVATYIQEAENKISKVESIYGPVDTTINTIGYANTALTQLDTFSSTYLQPLSTFNKAVMGIANVRPSN